MLANSPDTTALFLDTGFEPELSQPEVSNGLSALTDNTAYFQEEWARGWIKQPIGIESINSQTVGLIIANECTKKTLRNLNGKIISALLHDKNYDLDVISQLLDVGDVELDDGGREYVDIIDYIVQKLMGDDEELPIALQCLKNLSKIGEIKNIIKKHAKINKLYKKLTNMLKHADDNVVRYSLYLLISFLADTSLGKKLFNESSIREAFTLLFSTPSMHETSIDKDPIFKDLLGLMLDKKEYSQLFEKFAKDNWKSDFSWCSSKSLDAIIAINEILKRDLLDDMAIKSIQKFDLYNTALSYVINHYSEDALEFINLLLKKSSGNEWGKKCLDLVFALTNQYRTGNPFIDLFLHLHPDIIPQNNNCDLKDVLNKFYAKQISEQGPVPPCFTSFWQEYGPKQPDKGKDPTTIHLKLTSNSKESVLEALLEIQRLDNVSLESLADCISEAGITVENDALLAKKIDKLDKQLMDAVEESKKLLIVKEELMNAKMEILKGKIHCAEKEKMYLKDQYTLEISKLKDTNTNMALEFNSLTEELEEIKTLSDGKDKMIQTLSQSNEEKAQEINDLNQKVLELEESIGEQEEEHQEMVAKLAQSLDSLANRKTRISKKKTPPAQEDVDSLGKNLQSTRI